MTGVQTCALPISFTYIVAAGAGSWLVGLLYDATGSYRVDVVIMTIALAVAAALIVVLPQYQYATVQPGPMQHEH